MAQAIEDYTNPPDGSTFLEYCERCCENCRIVRWLWEDPPEEEIDDVYGAWNPSKKPQWSSSCPLCQQWRHLAPPEYEARGVCLKLAGSETEPYNILYVKFVKEGGEFAACSTDSWKFVAADSLAGLDYVESIKPIGVNWKAVREWIRHCTTNHKFYCAGPSEELHIPRLRIIDCKTGVVEPFSKNTAPYVALSYVWGQSQDAGVGYPQTILDSMEAVLALGLRYLWVDRICIDQEDDTDRSTQIAVMDQIYLRAYLTIISCSDDAEQGLPGVRKFARDSGPPLWLGDELLKRFCSPAESVRQSRWITRGWTYQENCFSRRRLFFTKQGVALWCTSMYYEESISYSLPYEDEQREDLFPPILQSIAPISSFEHSRTIMGKLLSEYTTRKITYENDALNACLGILNHLGYKHLWGVTVGEATSSLELCWVLSGIIQGRPERKAFPSWSWTRWNVPAYYIPNRYPSSIIAIKTQLPNGEEFDIIHDTTFKGNLGTVCSGRILSITGAFLTSRFFVAKDCGRKAYHCVFQSDCGADIKIEAFPDILDGVLPQTVGESEEVETLEVEPLRKNAWGYFTGQFLLVKRHENAHRRIGVALLTAGGDKHGDVCVEFERLDLGIVPMKGRHIRVIDLI